MQAHTAQGRCVVGRGVEGQGRWWVGYKGGSSRRAVAYLSRTPRTLSTVSGLQIFYIGNIPCNEGTKEGNRLVKDRLRACEDSCRHRAGIELVYRRSNDRPLYPTGLLRIPVCVSVRSVLDVPARTRFGAATFPPSALR